MDLDEGSLELEIDEPDVTEKTSENEFLDDDIKDDDFMYMKIPKTSRVILYHGNSLCDDDWMRQRIKSDINIDYYDSSYSLKAPYKIMSAKTLESNESLNDHLDNFAYDLKDICRDSMDQNFEDADLLALVKELADEESLHVRFNVKTAVDTFYVGRIRYGTSGGRLSNRNIYLEASFSLGHSDVMPLDFSLFALDHNDQKHNYSIFPGQMVLIKAQNPNGTFLRVSKVMDISFLVMLKFPPKCPPLLREKEPINIVCACGPFVKVLSGIEPDLTDVSYIKAIADYLKRYNPDILFLFGPFYDESLMETVQKWSHSQSLVNGSSYPNTYPYQWTLERLATNQIRALCRELEGLSVHTRIVLIPSPNELSNINIFPVAATDVKLFRNITSFSSPSLLSIDGLAVGLTSADILLHLSRFETHNYDLSQGSDRLKRLCEHVVNQRSFYPLLPPDLSVNIEYTMYKCLQMPVKPHLLILPSILRPFIYTVNETVVINPGRVAKNSIARIMIDPLKEQESYTGSLSGYINVEICKLNQEK